MIRSRSRWKASRGPRVSFRSPCRRPRLAPGCEAQGAGVMRAAGSFVRQSRHFLPVLAREREGRHPGACKLIDEHLRIGGRFVRPGEHAIDRKSVVSGKRVQVRVDLGGRRIIKKKKIKVIKN